MSGRSTPQAAQQRNSRNLSQIRQAQLHGGRHNDSVLASLRATQIVTSKPFLPAELIAAILDFLPVPDLMRFARVSRRLQEMVYDDTRWTQKLKAIGVWSEAEARQRVEDAMKRKVDAQKSKEADEAKRTGVNLPGSVNGVAPGGRSNTASSTIFDAGMEEIRHRSSLDKVQTNTPRRRTTLTDGFDDITISPSTHNSGHHWDSSVALNVLIQAKSIRGRARQEFGKIYGALGPLYMNLARARSHSDAIIFRTYRDPEQQAQILSSLKRFAKCDSSQEWEERETKLDSMIGIFENAVLREFEQGLAGNDVSGRMHRYAHVLVTLNGGSGAVDAFISHNPIMARTVRMGSPLDCLDGVASGHVDLNPSRQAFEKLAVTMVEQAAVIDRVFPPSVDALTPFLSRLCEEIISDYLTILFDEAHSKGIETYVKAVSGTLEQALRFLASIKPTKASPVRLAEKANDMIVQCYEKHIDLYLSEELHVFTSRADADLSQWEKELSDQEASTDSFFMSNINRQAAKRDFLSSFKKVVMMPVNVLPAFSAAKPAAAKSSAALESNGPYGMERSSSPALDTGSNTPQRPGTPQAEAPTTELAAKAAIMNSRLEGIKSLFSIEVALSLTHLAKACIERIAVFVRLGGQHGTDAKEQCGAIFVALLEVLGSRHIRNGFDKAIGHLGKYNPREVRELRSKGPANGSTTVHSTGVEPLVTFLELVNVGDLIQQMIDVFYAQELVATSLTDKDDFLDPAVKEKKRFEQMLDERVAAGLNRGIDVLIDEVEYICATTQSPTDFNPGATTAGSNASSPVDIGVTQTAVQIVTMIGGHTSMLTGTTDKNMLDVFMQEVGLRLFGALCKHFKRQRVSVDGAIKLICDINHYSNFIATLRQKPLLPYFHALREMSQIYLVHIDPPAAYFSTNPKVKRASLLSTKASPTALQAKELATIIADTQRYHGIFPAEEVYEFAERRADWYLVKSDVERAMYGVGCSVM